MAQSYTRQSSFADGDTITAALFNNEYNQLVNAFSYSSTNEATTGHRHDGSAGEGGNIPQIGDLDFLNKIVVDSTNNRWGFYVQVASSAVEQLRLQDGALIPVTDSDVDLGTSSLYFKDAYIDTVTTTGNVSIGGNLTVTGNATISGNLTFGDADTDSINLAAEIDSHIVPNTDDTYDLGTSTKQWRNLYIDGTAEVDTLAIDGTTVTSTAAELNILDGVTSTAAELNILDGVTSTTAELNILDGVTSTATEINIVDGDTAATSTTLADADRVVVNDAGTMKQVALTDFETYFEGALDTLSNVTTVGALNAGSITSGFGSIDNGSSAITTTGTVTYGSLSDGTITITAFADEDDMSSDSATLVPTQQSVKAYVDSQVTAQDLDFQGDSGGALSIDLDSESLTIAGGTGIDTSGATNTLTVAIDSTVATLTGTQTLTNKTLTTPIISSISNTGTLTLPTSTDTLVGRATTDTLTNKTLTSPVINTGVSGTAFLDDDTFGTATASTLASSESIKAYVDSTVAATNEVVEDSTPQLGGNLDLNSNDITGTGNINITGTIQSSGNITGTLATAAQPNITSVGTLTGLDVAGTPTFDGLDVDGSGDISGNTYVNSGNGTGTALKVGGESGAGIKTQYVFSGSTQHNWQLGFATHASQVMSITPSSSAGNTTFTTPILNLDGANSRVGIGTTSPSEKLDVIVDATGGLKLGTNADAGVTLTSYQGSTNSNVRTIDFNVQNFVVNTGSPTGTTVSEAFRVTNDGNVGIGTSSPSAKLTISGIVRSLRTDSTSQYGDFGQDSSGGFLTQHRPHASLYENFRFLASNNSGTVERMRIDSSGNVGIGTSSPYAELSIKSASPQVYLETAANGNAQINFNENADQLDVMVNNSSGKIAFGTNSTERMRIDSSGNVAIGSTNPRSHRLYLENAGSSGAGQLMLVDSDNSGLQREIRTDAGVLSFDYWDGSNRSNHLTIAANGNVGIGTSSPSSKLDVAGNIGSSGTISSTSVLNCNGSGSTDSQVNIGVGRNANGYAFLDLIGDTTYTDYGLRIIRNNSGANTTSVIQHRGTGTLGLLTQEAAAIQFSTNNFERMRIDSSGNVGIGTAIFTNSYKTYIEGLDQDTANLTDSGNHGATLYLRATANAAGSGGAVAFGTTFGNKTPFAAIKGHVVDGSTNTTGDLCFSTRAGTSETALTERIRLTAAGNVGIGLSSGIDAKLHIKDGDLKIEHDTHPRIHLEDVGNSTSEIGVSGRGAGTDGIYISGYAAVAANTYDFKITGSDGSIQTRSTIYPATGIQLGSSASSNLLDDYEEGTWTPTVVSGISSVGYAVQSGKYTKIGGLVYYSFHLQTNSGTATSSQLQLSGLPFTANNGVGFGSVSYSNSGFRANNEPTNFFPTSSNIETYETNGSSLIGTELQGTSFDLRVAGAYMTTA